VITTIEPFRVAAYLRWWERRPSRWLAFGDPNLEDLPGAQLFDADGEAHAAAVESGLLVRDTRHAAWQISGRGLCFVHRYYRTEPEQLGLFGGSP